MRTTGCVLWVLSVVGATAAGGPPSYPDHQDLLYYLDEEGVRHPVRTAEDWERRRRHVLAHFQVVAGRLLDASKKVPLAVKEEERVQVGRLSRRKISYQTEANGRVKAYLFVPALHAGARAPAVLCLHQTVNIGKGEPAGLGGKVNLRYGLELAERGYVTIAPDYPSFGDHTYDFAADRQWQSGTMKAVWDNMRAIDVLQSMAEVDGERIGAIGHSLGGHNAIFTAVFDERIKATVSSSGFTRFHKYYGGKLKGWTSERYMPRIASEYGNDPDRVPFDFPELIGAIAPRAFFTNSPLHDGNFEVSGVRDCIAAARPVYELLGAKEKLVAVYPDAGHDFPPGVREEAYRFLDRHLKG